MISGATMQNFAENWIANWNRRDVEAVLAHFADTAEFVSPVAERYAGSATLSGKAAIGDYWRAAVARIDVLEFTLDHASWDAELLELTVVYAGNLNGDKKRTCEIMRFAPDGLQIRGEALYGAAI